MNAKSRKKSQATGPKSWAALFLGMLVVLCVSSCNGCNGEGGETPGETVSLELNLQVCVDASTFSSRGLTVRWEGNHRSGGSSGETSFSIDYSVLSPLAESPTGRSWFRRASRIENLRAGDWDLEVEYLYPGSTGADIHERLELSGRSSVFFTHGNDDASTSIYPPCP